MKRKIQAALDRQIIRDFFDIDFLLRRGVPLHVDAETARALQDIINLGETSYVSIQDTILLLRLLQQGVRPDIVVFYDGVNDTFSAYQQGVAGLPQNEFNRQTEF